MVPRSWLAYVCLAVLLFNVLDCAPPARAASATISANFAAQADYPLIKSKFGVFNSGYVSLARWKRDINLIKVLRPARARWELMWGNQQNDWQPMVTGSAASPQYNFSQVDQLVDLLNNANIPPVPIFAYTPTPLKPAGGSWNDPPTNVTTWGDQVARAFADHWRATGRRIGSHEIWNEPDLPGVFWTGSPSQYYSLFNAGARGVRAGNPDAFVEGPALCCVSWQGTFMNYVNSNNLPLDAFSFHYYGDVTGSDLDNKYRGATDINTGVYRWASVDNNLNEFNPLFDFSPPTPVVTFREAALLLRSFNALLAKPWVTHVDWAQMQDPICPGPCDVIGLLDQDGHRRAAYNAFYLYANMPVERRQLAISGPIEGMASGDAHTSAVALWNLSGSEQTIDAALNNVPFATGNFRVYRIDATHASYFDNPASETLVPVEQRLNTGTSGLSWSGSIPNGGVVYLEAEDGSGTTNLEPVTVGKPIRVYNYNFDHSKRSYSSFDQRIWTGALGMGGEDWADAEVGIAAEQLPNQLQVSFDVDGALQNKDANSLLGMRVDYQTSTGYTKGMLFHGGLYNSGRSAPMPWGTQRQADQVIQVGSLSNFTVDLPSLAPAGWTGRAILSFLMQNSGANTRARVAVRSTSLLPPGSGNGLRAAYYTGMNFETFRLARTDPNIDVDWSGGSPDPSVPGDGFSARWIGEIQPRSSGTYTFYLNTDNGRRLWVNNQLIIDKWIDDWGVTYSGQINLTAGQKYDIRVEYFENYGGANAHLEWAGPGLARQIVPQNRLFP